MWQVDGEKDGYKGEKLTEDREEETEQHRDRGAYTINIGCKNFLIARKLEGF